MVKEIYVSGKDEPVSKTEKTLTNAWKIVSEKEINDYLSGKTLEPFEVPSIANSKYRHSLVLCLDEEVQFADEKNMVTFYDGNKEVAPYVNLNTEENIASGKPLRLVEQYYYDLEHVLRISKDKYICRPYMITASNSSFNLETLVETLKGKGQDNWIFIANKGGHRDSYVVQGKPTEEDLKNVIQIVPYYNQHESYTLYEVKGYYIPKNEEIKTILAQEQHGFKWCENFYKGDLPSKELKKIPLYDKQNIFAFCLDCYDSSNEYQQYIKENSKRIEKERNNSFLKPD